MHSYIKVIRNICIEVKTMVTDNDNTGGINKPLTAYQAKAVLQQIRSPG